MLTDPGDTACPSGNSGVESSATTFADLPADAQSSISAMLGRDATDYHASTIQQGYRMENRAQHLAAEWTAQGIQLRTSDNARWGMSLTGFGRGAPLDAIALVEPIATANRVEYRRERVIEWYVNGPGGLEQGFTLDAAPNGRADAPVTLALALSGDLTATVNAAGDALTLARADGSAVLRYAGLRAWDAAGQTLQAWLEIRDEQLLVRLVDAGAQYPITIDPTVEIARLSPGGSSCQQFGRSVAIKDNVIVVGADEFAVGNGAVYVFNKPVSGWASTSTYSAKLTASDGARNDRFGLSVAFDGTTIVVGAPLDDVTTNGVTVSAQGSAYVFVRPSGGWSGNRTQNAKLVASDPMDYDSFGATVAVYGNNVVVGMSAASRTGAVYVFTKPSGGWSGSRTETAKLVPNVVAQTDYFGTPVAMTSQAVVVGARSANSNKGAAYIFQPPVGGWTGTVHESAILHASDGQANDQFGDAVAVYGNTVVVGAYNVQNNAPTGSVAEGAAYLYQKPAGGWSGTLTQTTILRPSDRGSEKYFGISVAVSGDSLSGSPSDGTIIAVGATRDDALKGAAYLFIRPTTGWTTESSPEQKMVSSTPSTNDNYGNAIAIGGTSLKNFEMVVGAHQWTAGGACFTGEAYIYSYRGEVNSITRNQPTTYSLTPVSWTVLFEAPLAGVNAGNFELFGTAAGNATIASVSSSTGTGYSDTWTVTANISPAINGQLGLRMKNGTGVNLVMANLPFDGEAYTMAMLATKLGVTTSSDYFQAGQPISITVAGLDAAGNTVTTYSPSSPLRFASTAGTAPDGTSPIIPPNTTGTFVNGVATIGGFTFFKHENGRAIMVSETDIPATNALVGTSNLFTVNPGDTYSFGLAAVGTRTAGASFSLTATAYDRWRNVAVNHSAISGLTYSTTGGTAPDGLSTPFLPATTPGQPAFSAGVATVSGFRLYKAESNVTITIQDSGVSPAATGTTNAFSINPGTMNRFDVTVNSPQTAGQSFSIDLTATDTWYNIASAYAPANNLHYASTNGTAPDGVSTPVLPPNGKPTFTNGVASVSGFTLYKAEAGATISVNDSVNTSINGTSSPITVSPGATANFGVSVGATQTAGQPFAVTVTARDTWLNTNPNYAGSDLHYATTGGNAPNGQAPIVPGDGTPTFVNGVANVPGFNLHKAETGQTITVVETAPSSVTGTSGPFAVVHGGTTGFAMAAIGAHTAGQSFSVTVTAHDTWLNTATGYQPANNLHYATTGGTAPDSITAPIVPVDGKPTFTNGATTIPGFTLFKAESGVIVGVNETVTPSIAATSNPFTINPGAAAGFAVQAGAAQTAGQPFSITVTAHDTWKNVAAAYAPGNNLHFTTTAGNAPNGQAPALPADYKPAFSNGAATVSGIALFKAESGRTVTAAETGTSVAGTSGLFTVSPAGLEQFAWELTTPQKVGVPFTGINTLVAQDPYQNTVTTFSASANPVALTVNSPLVGSISGLGTAGNNVLNRTTDFSDGVANFRALGAQYNGTDGTGTLVAASQDGKSSTSPSITMITTPTISAPTSSAVTNVSAVLGATIDSNGSDPVTEAGIVYSLSQNPTTADAKLTTSTTIGPFTVSATGLTEHITYHYRGFATNRAGTSYTSDATFRTLGVPVVTGPTATNITDVAARLGGDVSEDGGATILERGVVYSLSNPMPTTSDAKQAALGSPTTGVFAIDVTGLAPAAHYYMRAYATNPYGDGYSTAFEFWTKNRVLSINRANATPSNAGAVSWNVTLAGNASALNIGNFQLTGAAGSGASLSGISGSGTGWTVTASTGPTDGALELDFANDTGMLPGVIGLPFTGQAYTMDKASPTVAIGAPSVSIATGGPVTFTITYDDTNFNASTLVAGDVTLNKSGSANGTVSVNGAGSTRTVTVSSISGDGSLSISLATNTASDLAGNQAAAAGPSLAFVVDNTPPTITIGAPSAALTTGGPVDFVITYGDDNFASSTLSPSDVTLNRSGTANGTVQVSGNGITRTVTISGITGDGSLSMSVAANTATDLAGHRAPGAGPSPTINVDNTSPDTTITSAPPTLTNSKSASFTFSGHDDGLGLAGYECQLDSGEFLACSSPQAYGDLTIGVHNFYVRTVDAAGNRDPSPASVTWTVADPPTVSSPTAGAVTDVSATLGGNVDGDGGTNILERGVVYSVNSTNGDPLVGGAGVTKLNASGTTGALTVNAIGLAPFTTYAFKAFVRNGIGTSHSSLATFTTLATTNIALDAPVVTYNANGLITVTVTSPYAPLTGTVSLSGDGAPAATSPLASLAGSSPYAAAAVFALANPQAGDHPLTANYAAQGVFNASRATGTLHVNQAATTVAVVSSSNTSDYGQTVTFTVTVSSAAGTPNGTVQFKEGATLIGSALTLAGGKAVMTSANLGVGNHTLNVVYSGATNYGASSGSRAHTVNRARTSTTIKAQTPNPSLVGQSAMVEYSVAVQSPGAGVPTGTVTVSDGATSCTGSVGAGRCALTFTSAGAKSLRATYAGDSNYAGSVSSAVTQTVSLASCTPPAASRTASNLPQAKNAGPYVSFLPLVQNGAIAPPAAPDLIVQNIATINNTIQVVLKNQGNRPVADEFWVDLYLNPKPAPTRVNQPWQMLASQGAVWGVTSGALPLGTGGTLTLSLGDVYYWGSLSQLPPTLPSGTCIYVQVDSANAATNYGAVLENHEITGEVYDNVTVFQTTAPMNISSAARSSNRASPSMQLPRRSP